MTRFLHIASLAIALAFVPVRADAAAETFTLQIATYSDRTDAERVAGSLPDAWIEEVRNGGRTLFRVNYRRFEVRDEALKAQWDLEDKGYNSFIQKLYT